MPFSQFDRSRLRLLPLAGRIHDVDRSQFIFPDSARKPIEDAALPVLAERIVEAKAAGRSVILFCGAHVLRKGNGPLLIDMMERGLLSHLALNGAGAIHDLELAMIGQTCESVARYLSEGQFGLWQETGRLNDAAVAAYREGIGLGEAIGQMIEAEGFPYRQTSVLAAGARLGVPVTVHVAIGQDIVHEHPNFDPAATGAATYADFLVFADSVARLDGQHDEASTAGSKEPAADVGGVFLNIGTAVAGPEVFLKALSMARNVAHQEGRTIGRFTTAVFDMVRLGDRLDAEAAKTDPRYYFRPYKTVLVRSVADGGESYYVEGDHADMVPGLYDQIMARVAS